VRETGADIPFGRRFAQLEIRDEGLAPAHDRAADPIRERSVEACSEGGKAREDA
jgi:hypothetical protein